MGGSHIEDETGTVYDYQQVALLIVDGITCTGWWARYLGGPGPGGGIKENLLAGEQSIAQCSGQADGTSCLKPCRAYADDCKKAHNSNLCIYHPK